MIMESIPETGITYVLQVANIEKEQKFDVPLIQTMAKILEVLPNLDA